MAAAVTQMLERLVLVGEVAVAVAGHLDITINRQKVASGKAMQVAQVLALMEVAGRAEWVLVVALVARGIFRLP